MQVLVERVRQTAWEMHYAKTDSIIYLFRLTMITPNIAQFCRCGGEREDEPERVLALPLPDEHPQEVQRHDRSVLTARQVACQQQLYL